MGQKAPNDFIAVGTSAKRGINGPHPLHAIESLAGRLIVYDPPIGFDFGGDLVQRSTIQRGHLQALYASTSSATMRLSPLLPAANGYSSARAGFYCKLPTLHAVPAGHQTARRFDRQVFQGTFQNDF